jgi:Legume lectin domain.
LDPRRRLLLLHRAIPGRAQFQSVSFVDPAATSLTDALPYFGTVFYRVRAFSPAGDSAVSNTVNAILGPVTIDDSDGFSSYTGLAANGSAKFIDSLVQLTDGGGSEAGSFFSTTRVGIRGFTTSFRFRVHEGTTPRADGFTFIIQSNSPAALGASGMALGYGGIRNSLAVKFDFFNNSGEGPNSTGVFTGGRIPTVRLAGLPPEIPDLSVSLDGTGIDLASQSEKMVELSYDGAVLTETITDLDAGLSFTQTYTLDIAQIVGAETAYVGFGGATGGSAAIQDIQAWFFDERENDVPPRTPSGLRAISTNTDTIAIQWKSGNAYTAEAYVIERSADGLSFTPIATVSSFMAAYTDRGLDPGVYFYRVRAVDAGQRLSGYSNVDSAGIGDGFGPAKLDDLSANGSASSTRLTNSTSQAGSIFTNAKVGIKNFTTTFTFTIRPGTSPMADGMAFVIQSNSPAALGSTGMGLGFAGIPNSVAVKFDIYNNAGEGTNSTGLFTAGHSPTVPDPGSGDVLVNLDGTGIDLKSTNPFQVQIIYSGGQLEVTITDTVTQKSAHQSYLIDIVSAVGGNQAYIGFTAGTGGLSAIQEVQSWSFQ